METRSLGQTNINVSVIGFGGIPIQRVDELAAVDILLALEDNRINFIDTARGYTVSEAYIGQALEHVGRDKFVLASKSMKRDYKGILEDVEISLENLKTTYIDLYQLHNVRTMEDLETILGEDGALKGLKEAKAKGLIKEIGITGHNVDILDKAIDTGEFATIQCPYNPMERQGEDLFKKAKDLDIGVIIMKPLAGGAIKNKSLALRFIINNPNITVAIPGMDSVEQVEENASFGLNMEPLNEEEMETIMGEAKELGEEFCRRCGYCQPCPEGIDIPSQFLMEGYYTRYNLQDWAKERYLNMEIRARDCIECGICETKCPYDLPIRKMLKKVENTIVKEAIE